MKRRELIRGISLSAILIFFGIVMVAPLFWMASASFKYETDVFAFPFILIPDPITLTNYQSLLFSFPYEKWYMNTLISTSGIIGLTLLFGSISGYAFAKLHFAGKNVVLAIFLSSMMIPVQVRLIPQFIMYRQWGIIDTLWCIVLPWAYNSLAIFLMRQFFTSLPDELMQAARIDGCSEYGIFAKIALPLAKSQLVALGVIAFQWGWNDYLGPLVYIGDTNKQILSVGIASVKGEYSSNFGVQMAGATLALIPVIVLYLFAQKHFVQGIAMTGIKE